MNLFLEILDILLRVLWSILESIYRTFIPVPKKKVDGEIVLITGGGGRIAECMAMEMAKLNVTIVLWDINEDAVNTVAEKIRGQGTQVYTYICDITDKDEVYRVAEKVKEEVGHVTILINNAGILIAKSFMNYTDKELVKQVEVNTIANFWTTKAFLPHMYNMDHGHIVTIASLAGVFGVHNLSGYIVSKHGAVGFHRGLRRDLQNLGKTGINMTCVCPSFVDTPLIADTIVTGRFSALNKLLKPEYVAKEIVDAILRNENFVVIPGAIQTIRKVTSLLPQKGQDIIRTWQNVGFGDENAHLGFKKLDKQPNAENDDKKSD